MESEYASFLSRKIEKVKLDTLIRYPGNARRGDVAGISESLKLGQFRPLLVQRSTRHIVAGNHTADAAQLLGWDTIDVTFLDIDDETARRVCIADNRYSDLGIFDEDLLRIGLCQFDDLTGTGFTELDLQAMSVPPPPAGDKDILDRDDVRVTVGTVSFSVPSEQMELWDAALVADVGADTEAQIATVRARLGL